MKKIAILGSTGSIGVNTLNVISAFKDKFQVVGLSANSNLNLLKEQIDRFRPKVACLADRQACAMSGDKSGLIKGVRRTKIVSGLDGLIEVATHPEADLVVMAIVGSASLIPLLKAIEAKKEIALASKEAMVSAGEIVVRAAGKNNVKIIPVDSEHSAIFQCLNGRPRGELKKIYLTGTGGPLRKVSGRQFDTLTAGEVLNHPKWKMGKKISVDSATLMNKGLEVIEAKWLFSAPLEKIEVLIHPEALVHSMVEFIDASILAQVSVPDMRLPIQYALAYPERLPQKFSLYMDFMKSGRITFSRPNTRKFPCLALAYSAAREGGTHPAVLNASNEEAVMSYLEGRIKFTDIPRIVEKALSRHRGKITPDLNDILNADAWSREEVRRNCSQ
ncbi:MAG: 1-deoxy-D-xylulose-5-phosphate reductoisomerase [Candidatus Omnitrophica bacterium]|nr:1-deoxy-D-xylulose-5-phosphate reductoisomerase [Candidatus Omnitrophota bacterium]